MSRANVAPIRDEICYGVRVTLARMRIDEALTALGSKSPTPGGGAVAGLAGAVAASTARMVVSYSLGKASLAEYIDELQDAAEQLDRAQLLFLEFADEDAAAYAALNDLWRLPRTDTRRESLLPDAAERAASVPASVLAASCSLLRLLETLVPITNKQLSSDLAVAAVIGASAARSAAWNIRANVPLLSPERGASFTATAEEGVRDAIERAARVEAACAER